MARNDFWTVEGENMNQRRLSYKDYLFSSGVIIDHIIYFFTEKENFLMEVNMNDWKIKYLNKFIDSEYFPKGRTDLIRTIGNRIFKLVLSGKYVEEFSLEDGKYERVEIGDYNRKWNNYVAFEVNKHFLYVFPRWERKIIKIDVDNYEVEKIEIPRKQKKDGLEEKFECFSMAYKEKSIIWLFEKGTGYIIKYDMDKNTFYRLTLPNEVNNCVDMCRVDREIYFLTYNNEIYIWNADNGKYHLLWRVKQYYKKDNYFAEMVIIKQKIILLPGFGEDIIIIDCSNNTYQIYDKYPKDFVYMDIKWAKYINRFEDKKNYYYPMRLSNYMAVIDKNDGNIDWIQMIMPLENERMNVYFRGHLVAPEGLKSLLYFLERKAEKIQEQQCNNVGNIIWKKLKR